MYSYLIHIHIHWNNMFIIIIMCVCLLNFIKDLASTNNLFLGVWRGFLMKFSVCVFFLNVLLFDFELIADFHLSQDRAITSQIVLTAIFILFIQFSSVILLLIERHAPTTPQMLPSFHFAYSCQFDPPSTYERKRKWKHRISNWISIKLHSIQINIKYIPPHVVDALALVSSAQHVLLQHDHLSTVFRSVSHCLAAMLSNLP